MEQNHQIQLRTLLISLEEKRTNSLLQASAFASVRDALQEKIRDVVPVEETDRGLVLRLKPSDRGQLGPDTKTQLDLLAAILKAYKALRLEVEAYAESGNVALAQRQSDAVVNYLKKLIPNIRLRARGFGRVAVLPTNANEPLGHVGDRLEVVISGEAIGVWAPILIHTR